MTNVVGSVIKPMVEQLESRRLMAVVVDVRLPGGGKELVVNTVGQEIDVEVWATVTGFNGVIDEGLQSAVGSLLSADVSGGAVRGTLSAATVAPFNALGSQNGTQADLDSDGDLDVGSNNNGDAEGFLFARSASMTTDGGTEVTQGRAFKIADATFTVTQLLDGAQTNLIYRVRSSQQSFVAQVDGTASTIPLGGTFVAGSGVTLTRPQSNSIQGRVFNDKNANGIFDGDDTGIDGFRVFLDTNGNAILDEGEISKPVSATGTYTFLDVPSGTYRVREVFRSGWRQSFPKLGYYEVLLRGNDKARSQSFANTDTIVIKGTVWMDANVDRQFTPGESGISGWMLFIDHNKSGVLDKGDDWTLSDANGNYRFFNVPGGNYHVRIVPQEGFRQTAPRGGFHDITLPAGGTVSNKLFGFKRLK